MIIHFQNDVTEIDLAIWNGGRHCGVAFQNNKTIALDVIYARYLTTTLITNQSLKITCMFGFFFLLDPCYHK